MHDDSYCQLFSGAVAVNAIIFTFGLGQNIQLTGVQCTGNESSLASCPTQPTSCSHTDAAGVRCQQGQK